MSFARTAAESYPAGVQPAAAIESAFVAHRGRLWGLCYRMSGCAADADDWLQDAFERALSRPPADLDRDLGAWLTRITMNACRDHLRRRRHRAYAGPWLPGPLETSELFAMLGDESPSPEARYGQLESVSLGFLHALESLTPNQRAVLLLRDVVDCSVRETAEALALSEASVKTTLHRARRALADYDARRAAHPSAHNLAKRRALEAFLAHLAARNVEALKVLVAEDVVALNDGGGEYIAAQRPVRGQAKVLLFHRKVARPVTRALMTTLNGEPALVLEARPGRLREPQRMAFWVELDTQGRIDRVHAVMADRKLARLPWHRVRRPGPILALHMLVSACTTPPPRIWLRGALGRVVAALSRRVRTPNAEGRPSHGRKGPSATGPRQRGRLACND